MCNLVFYIEFEYETCPIISRKHRYFDTSPSVVSEIHRNYLEKRKPFLSKTKGLGRFFKRLR